MPGPTVPYSAVYMGPERDLFWNPDHIICSAGGCQTVLIHVPDPDAALREMAG